MLLALLLHDDMRHEESGRRPLTIAKRGLNVDSDSRIFAFRALMLEGLTAPLD
jgi:hypothetical protein